jgi:4-cresol dehydrogenase (hydroxylating)
MALFQGVPSEDSVRSTYWRKGPAPAADLDPERDGCGVIWAVPAVPMEGAAVLRAVTEAGRVLRDWGFDPLLAMTVPTPRVGQLVPLIVYDRDDPAQDERARGCHADLTRAMNALGCLPARAGVLDAVPPSVDDTDAALARLRDALDPAGVLSPGRYGIGQ